MVLEEFNVKETLLPEKHSSDTSLSCISNQLETFLKIYISQKHSTKLTFVLQNVINKYPCAENAGKITSHE